MHQRVKVGLMPKVGNQICANTYALAQKEAQAFVRRNPAYSHLLSDFISESMVALVHASRQYDASTHYRFTTFATHVIRNHLYRYMLSSVSMIRVPPDTNRSEKTKQAATASRKLTLQMIDPDYPAPINRRSNYGYILDSLNLLSPKQKQAITYYLAGYTPVEIGRKLKISKTAVQHRIENALTYLRKHYGLAGVGFYD